jgi:HEAT repeat protein
MVNRTKVLIIIILVFLGLSWAIGRAFFFCPTGSRSGKVIDAATGKPIKDAVVFYEWKLVGGFFIGSGEFVAASDEIKTNEEGEYYIPGHWIRKHFWFWNVTPEEVFIYKEGYAWYRVYDGEVQHFMVYMPDVKLQYRKKHNLVKLQPWDSRLSHVEHMNIFTGLFGPRSTMLYEGLKNEIAIAQYESHSVEAQKQRSNTVCYQLMEAKRKYENNKMSREEYIALLNEGLKSPNIQTLRDASAYLGELGDKSYVPVLIEFLRKNLYRDAFGEIFFYLQKMIGREDLSVGNDISRDVSERKKALAEMEKPCQEYVTKNISEYYGNIAVTGKEYGVRCNAIKILGESKDKEATPYLLKCLDEKADDAAVCHVAIIALGKNGDTSAIPELKNKLKHQSMPIRQEAARVLHRLGDDSGAPIMIEYLRSHDEEESARAVDALSEIAGRDFCEGKMFSSSSSAEQQKAIQKCLDWWKTNKKSLNTQ